MSKTHLGIAVWKLIEMGRLGLDTALRSVLDLKTPAGKAPKDSRFGDVAVNHLLSSISGIAQSGIWGAVDANAALKGTLPASGMEAARWIAGRDMAGDPGNRMNAVSGNTDHFLLSLMVQRVMDATSFETALKTLVLAPLSMTRTRPSRPLIGSEAADEARYHLAMHDPDHGWPLALRHCEANVCTNDRPLVQSNCGGWDCQLFDGCGGLAAAVVDVARLAAMLSCRSGNPVLPRR